MTVRKVSRIPAIVTLLVVGMTLAAPTVSQIPPPAATGEAKPAGRIERLSGVWIEGPGFEITYGGTYDGCAQRCLGNAGCVMIEYYRPEKKCNLYNAARPPKKGGSSDVGIRR